MEKRYQVFISSTYTDLTEERRYVMQALMELDCIPAGMELFPAADEEQWEFIKKVIDNCDYYLLIIGGRYGSTSADGISYTEKEFDYAVEKGIKVICLIHKNPDAIPVGKSETDPEMKKKLILFCEKAKKGRIVKQWEKPEELQMQTVTSLNYAIRNYPAIGFVRANLVPDESSLFEINKLRNQITELETQLAYASNNAPAGTEGFAQGDDLFEIRYTYRVLPQKTGFEISFLTEYNKLHNASFKISWNVIFSTIAPLLVNEANETALQEQLNLLISDSNSDSISKKKEFVNKEISNFVINNNDFQKIKIQLKSLGLITQSTKNRSVKDNATYWTLTPYGDNVMTRLIAIKRNV
ncbi:MAG: DUF4062 domain-containing protein [Treponema sp.]|nr:DUF4062 domain-containing protein [Treponema sp.]